MKDSKKTKKIRKTTLRSNDVYALENRIAPNGTTWKDYQG